MSLVAGSLKNNLPHKRNNSKLFLTAERRKNKIKANLKWKTQKFILYVFFFGP